MFERGEIKGAFSPRNKQTGDEKQLRIDGGCSYCFWSFTGVVVTASGHLQIC